MITVTNTNPSEEFGGTWISIGSGKTLVGVDTEDADYNTVEKTGGSKTKTLIVENLPAHNHPATSSSTSSSSSTFTGTAVTSGGMSANSSGTFIANVGTTSRSGCVTQANVAECYNHCSKSGNGKFTINVAHTHSVTAAGTVSTTTTTTTTTTVNNTGSGTAFDVKNPYLTVYFWKKTA
jgi:microcystin-dependent protein